VSIGALFQCPCRLTTRLVLFAAVVSSILGVRSAQAGDWPMWRRDAGRSAASAEELPRKLHLQWVREYPRLRPTWKDPINQDRMPFDRSYEPVAAGGRVFLGFNSSDKMVALDLATGSEEWSFYSDGPVRLPPVVWEGKLYFVSDDGYLYCLDTETGSLLWKHRGGPSDRKLLGNERLICTWPARGGPVIADGVVYFAAGIWPFMGVFIHGLDAETGEPIWTNDGSGARFMAQPHWSPAFAGVAPQGSMAVSGDRLLIAGGRSVPACYDRRTGEFLYYRLAANQRIGGSGVASTSRHFVNWREHESCLYDLETGDLLIQNIGSRPVLTEETLYFGGDSIVALVPSSVKPVEYDAEVKDKTTGGMKTVRKTKWIIGLSWQCPVPARGDLIKAGPRLYAGDRNVVRAVDIPAPGAAPRISWSTVMRGMVSRLVAADSHLLVVTLEGRIYSFGPEPVSQVAEYFMSDSEPSARVEAAAQAQTVLDQTGVRDGYCVVYGVKDTALVAELARRSDLQIIGLCPEAERVDAMRRELDAQGLYGTRIALLHGDPMSVDLPPYFASLTVFADADSAHVADGDVELLRRVFEPMRPYGGVAWLPLGGDERGRLADAVEEANLPRAELVEGGGYCLLRRVGRLPGSGDWTHQYGNIANTVKSDDERVRSPLGLLWFGGSSHMDVLPRHGHGPPEQVIGGRLFIEGIDCMSARDVYTGRVLWKRELPALNTFGIYYNESYNPDPLDTSYNQQHIAGANARGTNFVATPDALYIIHGPTCLLLDPATGVTMKRFRLPRPYGVGVRPEWGYLGVYNRYLIAGTNFVRYSDVYSPVGSGNWHDFDKTSSRGLVVMDRYTGEILWSMESRFGLRHTAIVAGSDRLFCIDRMPQPVLDGMVEAGQEVPKSSRLMALDVETGAEIWTTTENVFGTWLGYSDEFDVLLEAGRPSRDMLAGEPSNRMIAYRGRDGTVLWDKDHEYGGPPMLHGRVIITQGQAFDLLTGEPILRRHPLTDEELPWTFTRHYGCNTAICSEHLITFRSAAAGFFDLSRDSGTGNLGGFKSGCTSNLIAADGVLNAPDYTRTCTCSYQNQTSLALIHMPENEVWTFSDLPAPDGVRVKRVGINLGAPGDRLAGDGVLWLDYPSRGGTSPDIPVSMQPEQPDTFCRHPSNVVGGGLTWVCASGCTGLTELKIELAPADLDDGGRAYTVRLYFADPDNDVPGRRRFDVRLQGERVLEALDVAGETGGRLRPLVKEFTGIRVQDALVLGFAPVPGDPSTLGPVLCGVEAVMEEQQGE